jgi:hypothetical protein
MTKIWVEAVNGQVHLRSDVGEHAQAAQVFDVHEAERLADLLRSTCVAARAQESTLLRLRIERG